MKKLSTLFVIIALTISVFAQSPQKMSYQAVIRNSSGQLVSNHAVGMRISILQGSATGTPIYVETQNTTTNANGLATIEIGGGTIVTGTFAGINWSTGVYFIKTETDPTGGTTYSITGTSQLLSVPYAIHSKTAETAIDAVKITGDQIIAGNKTFTGTTTVVAPVNASDAATKAYVDDLVDKILQLQAEVGVSDIDDNHYKAVKLGNQVWMAENLKVTNYNNGTEIPLVSANGDWAALTTPAYCWYNNNEAGYKNTYGALYNWFAASNVNICPSGWHVPLDAEWDILMDYLIANGYNYDGTTTGNKVAKALASTSGWTSSGVSGAIGNTDFSEKRNVTGFSAPAGGYRYITGDFNNIGNFSIWWSSSDYSGYDGKMGWKRLMKYDNTDVNWSLTEKLQGCSVRCVRD